MSAGWSPDAPASEVDVLWSLRFAERAARKALSAELAGSGVYAGQELVLVKLVRHGSMPVAQLAKVLDVEVPTATRTAQRMESSGLVRRLKTAEDARQVRVELTDKGREMARRVEELNELAAKRALAGIDAEQRRLLRNLLWTITANVDELG